MASQIWLICLPASVLDDGFWSVKNKDMGQRTQVMHDGHVV